MKKVITWVVVADGSKAKIFESDWSKHNLRLISTLDYDLARVHSKEFDKVKPHGIFEREERETRSDAHRQQEMFFAHYIADLINEAYFKPEFNHLIIVAPPKTLGEIRSKLRKEAKSSLTKEISKDLTNIDEAKLPKIIWQ